MPRHQGTGSGQLNGFEVQDGRQGDGHVCQQALYDAEVRLLNMPVDMCVDGKVFYYF
jgi:hypothetical protein